MTTLHTLGFPRIGAQRELKQAQEAFWRGESSVEALHITARQLRQRHWLLQKGAGIERIAVGDFTLYDHVLDHQVLFGALPARFGLDVANLSTEDYFALARGNAQQPALEMTKWFGGQTLAPNSDSWCQTTWSFPRQVAGHCPAPRRNNLLCSSWQHPNQNGLAVRQIRLDGREHGRTR